MLFQWTLGTEESYFMLHIKTCFVFFYSAYNFVDICLINGKQRLRSRIFINGCRTKLCFSIEPHVPACNSPSRSTLTFACVVIYRPKGSEYVYPRKIMELNVKERIQKSAKFLHVVLATVPPNVCRLLLPAASGRCRS